MRDKDSKPGKANRFRYKFVRMVTIVLSRISSKFYEMEQFKYFTLSAIESEKRYIEKRFDEETEDMTEDQLKDYFDWNAEDFLMVDDVFRKISLNSFIIILYSYIEDGLNSVCRAMYSDRRMEQKKANLKAKDEGREPVYKNLLEDKYKDFDGRHQGITKARRYLDLVFGVRFDSVKVEWEEINALAKIRSAIVHDNSFAKDKIENDQKIKQHVKAGRLEITEHDEDSYGRIVIKTEYLDAILPIAEAFFKKLDVRCFSRNGGRD